MNVIQTRLRLMVVTLFVLLGASVLTAMKF